ncbi:dihydrolipoamide S-acetyltransferase muc isoform X3 [Arctopsyche grandis]|uniref:dihydrolipoamide S-acetyltransferase muc isoform X3 n=1 Tax=Arctopsyche grandis TaxID=121162 RepID=UPI00406D9EAD
MRALLRLWRAGGGAGAGARAGAGAEAHSHHSKHSRAAARILASSTAHHHHSSRFRDNVTLPQLKRQTFNPNFNQIRHYADLPSHTKVALPALSPTMELGTIINWEKKEGDKLNDGDLLCEIETDKATMGFETPGEGYLAKILTPAGTKGVPVGKLICIIVEDEGDIAAFKDFADDGSAPKAAEAAAPAAAPAPAAPTPSAAPPPPPGAAPGSRLFVSPMARRLAEAQNLRLQGPGSGIYGSIVSSDLSAASAGAAMAAPMPPPPPGARYQDIPLTGMRATIAKRLLQSKTTIPHYQLSVDINVDKISKMRSAFNKQLEKEGVKLSVNDFIIKATALACKKVPAANSAWMETFIRQFDTVDICVAVSTDKGLITPIVFGAEGRGLAEISTTVKALAMKARDGKLQPAEFQGGSFSISNLGMFGVTSFNAIINPPQSCILAVGTTQQRIVPDKDSEKGWKQSEYISVTLSCDHRVVDGAVGAQWLMAFRKNLEDPTNMLL